MIPAKLNNVILDPSQVQASCMFRKVHIVVISKQLIPESNNFFPETKKGGTSLLA